MSRRPPNPAADRAAQNTQTIKTLLKLDANKVCADCKRNKHPRWASWNLGVFICIRCSGIHRGMGTHISRVKSVDLDTWTDEQLQSILSWGNARANKYWEHKLAPGHVPSDSKMENFIRTKYELKRWVMDGPMPNPASLDADGDDDIPLSIVKEKQNIDRKESIRKSVSGSASGSAAAEAAARAAARSRAPVVDLIGGNDSFPSPSISSPPPPPRASTAGPAAAQVAPKGIPVPPKATTSASSNSNSNTRDSLLGLDFLGSQPAAPARPSSTAGSTSGGGQSRPDLKQSILSLYATAPRTQPAQAHHGGGSGSFGSLHSPSQSQNSFGSGVGGLVDPFSSLSFVTAPASTPSPKPVDAFSGLSGLHNRQSSTTGVKTASSTFGSLGGGSFFEAKSAAPAVTSLPKPAVASSSAFGGFDAFSSAPSLSKATAAAAAVTPAASSSAFGDLFDFSSATSAPAPTAAPAAVSPPTGASNAFSSVFNLSAQPAKPTPTAAAPAASPLAAVSANWSNSDVWGGHDGWGSSTTSAAPAAPTATASYSQHVQPKAPVNDFGWGSSAATTTASSFATQSIVPGANGSFATAPKVAADEEFGGWTSSTAVTTTTATAKPAAGFGGSEDLFSNVWG
ncbi:stromal membrane-associated protein [Grosmannia clavigera kw1407]|uniref:Stromal membrane-associated protein n=1 Tax=Grosmannia clavigera (strain kw1407 / UAMH 11150) TaxID=655863 RepID=F0XLW5_GROCL|nr:stromal membrane-associated protein [Grosmannia clavigera kw1407]EFX01120.1 stromal membrane-associated protein [Grosmannia clavigera kw1407]